MHYIFKATIKFDTDESHPDEPKAKGLTLTDTYNFDADYFNAGIQSTTTVDDDGNTLMTYSQED